MNAMYSSLCLAALLVSVALASTNQQQQAQETTANELKKAQVGGEEMLQITKSLEDLLNELSALKKEASGRLSQVKNRAGSLAGGDQERIRQTKVSRFVLKRVAELESESFGMREELSKLFGTNNNQQQQQQQQKPSLYAYQEDQDFDEPAGSGASSTQQAPAASSSEGMPASATTLKPSEIEEEAAKIGFDVEALKKLGAELETELEARAQQNPESLRGVHEQVIKLVDNMVQNYLANVRSAVQRMTNLIDNRRGASANNQPRQSPANNVEQIDDFDNVRPSVLKRIQALSNRFHEFGMQWSRTIGKQQSPLIDRIPPRGVELWRDFWDTVRKQVRRINEEFWQLSRDMTRTLTGGRLPIGQQPREQHLTSGSLLYYSADNDKQQHLQVSKGFQDFYEKMSVTLGEESQKMDALNKIAQSSQAAEYQLGNNNNNNNNNNKQAELNNLIDEQDDEATRDELTRNVALRQQIQQEISVFGSIFDIMRTFIQRLRESATNMVRDVMQPVASNNNNNDPVTPGSLIKPQVDKLLEETIDSQRGINGQSKPVLLPNTRPSLKPRA